MKKLGTIAAAVRQCKQMISPLSMMDLITSILRILRYRGYLNVEINIDHIDIANLRDGNELSNAMVDYLLAC